MLSLLLLGLPQMLQNGQPLTVARRKSRALVYYLAAHTRPLARTQLLATFWPDTDRAAAQQVLRTTLHGLRKSLGAALTVEDDVLGLAPGVDVDVRQFAAALQGSAAPSVPAQSVLALYRGDFLEGFDLPDTPAFEDWAAAERERYRRLAVRGLTAISRQYETEQNYGAALEALDRALAFDALQEDLQRAALRLQTLAGDRAGAIRRYEHLRRLLDEEMGVPPMAETRAVYDDLLMDKIQASRPPAVVALRPAALAPRMVPTVSQLPFVGRAAELKQLHAGAAAGALVLIEGEPGLGKTRLAEAYLLEANALVVAGAAREMESSLPYQPMIEALRSLLSRPDWPIRGAALRDTLPPVWLAEAARLLPELGAEGLPAAAADESRLWEGMYQLLLALSRQHRVVLFLDDAHWADASTLAFLGYLARRGPNSQLSVLITARQVLPRTPLAALIQALTREGRLARLPLARLTPAELEALAARLSPQQSGPLTEWLTRTSEGNPYILTELVRYVREQGWLREGGELDSATLQTLTSPIVPQSVYTLIQSRLQRLTEPSRRMLDAAVAVGREFDYDIAAHAAALSETAALDALDELRTTGLIRPVAADATGRLHSFDHSLTMEVAYREVGEARHRLLHRRVAEALEAAHRQPPEALAGVLAAHFTEGNAPGRAAPYAFRAGQQAARLAAWAEAIGFYEQALAGTEESGRRVDIEMALGQAHLAIGHGAQASEAYRSAEQLATAQADAGALNAARLALGQSLLGQGRYGEAIALARELATGPERVSAEILWGTTLAVEGADLTSAAQHLQSAAALLRDESGPVDAIRLAQVTFELGSVSAQQGDLPRAVLLYRESLALAQSADGPLADTRLVLAYNNLAYHLLLLQDPTALQHAQTGLQRARDKGLLGLQPFLLSTLGEIALAAADLATAEHYFQEGLALAEQLALPERIAGLTANLGLLAQRQGQTALAIHRLSTALTRADTVGTWHLAAQIRLWLVPLLPPSEARILLTEARVMAESGGRRRLLAEVDELERAFTQRV